MTQGEAVVGESSPVKTYKCARCGMQSTVKEAFLEKQGYFSVDETLCVECWTKHKASGTLLNFLLMGGFGVFFYLVLPNSWFRLLYLQMLVGMILMIPLTVLHELAHALVTWLVGLRVFAVSIGVGPVVAAFRFLGFNWHLRQVMLSGATQAAGPKKRWYRLRMALLILAGPGLHILLIALILRAGLDDASRGFWLNQLVMITFWTNVVLLLANLFPRRVSMPGNVIGTDGWMVFHMLTCPDAVLDQQFANYYALEAIDAANQGNLPAARQWVEQGLSLYPDNVAVLNTLGFVYSALFEAQKAREVFLRVLAHNNGQSELMKYVAMNNIAYTDVLLEDPALLAEADAYSTQAHQNMAWEPAILGTRGAVLVWLGQVDPGIELLKSAMTKSTQRGAKAIDACFLARAELRRGDHAAAHNYLASARQLNPSCPLIARVEREAISDQLSAVS